VPPARRVRIHPEAIRDLTEGRDFYAKRSLVAAARLLIEVDAAISLICESPERFPAYQPGMKRYVMSAFPYSILYRIGTGSIDIYAVAHAKRRPLYWRGRRFKREIE
jgi:plasmid stabilization system protein ParE